VSFERRHDHETGDSGAGSSQRRSRASQDQVEAVAPELEDEVQDDAPDAVLPSDEDDDDDARHEPTDGRYGGGPTDLTLLHSYHKHRANRIWAAKTLKTRYILTKKIYLKYVYQNSLIID
jgi:hypothetical protein